ncbi:hypothetical protein CXG81DRAFT_16627 [Caulochytrium protostelioides]|uniref:Uncharacterized protein n=1 Tax=Caulochytrium protostelioides TaxID=1555241 RepID=A0A4P9XEF6_9FUNG|nr:hypothetical protein CXG81DRAFT_16627 [Caulochytrium protostelioides]|eukprot:RKP03923.1 hypothetical protein CXG81DRAFT_16627 [Caulochytrium protostelioides]
MTTTPQKPIALSQYGAAAWSCSSATTGRSATPRRGLTPPKASRVANRIGSMKQPLMVRDQKCEKITRHRSARPVSLSGASGAHDRGENRISRPRRAPPLDGGRAACAWTLGAKRFHGAARGSRPAGHGATRLYGGGDGGGGDGGGGDGGRAPSSTGQAQGPPPGPSGLVRTPDDARRLPRRRGMLSPGGGEPLRGWPRRARTRVRTAGPHRRPAPQVLACCRGPNRMGRSRMT